MKVGRQFSGIPPPSSATNGERGGLRGVGAMPVSSRGGVVGVSSSWKVDGGGGGGSGSVAMNGGAAGCVGGGVECVSTTDRELFSTGSVSKCGLGSPDVDHVVAPTEAVCVQLLESKYSCSSYFRKTFPWVRKTLFSPQKYCTQQALPGWHRPSTKHSSVQQRAGRTRFYRKVASLNLAALPRR